MIAKGLIPFSGANSFAIMEVPQKTRAVRRGRAEVSNPGVLGTRQGDGAVTDQVRYGGWTRAQMGLPLASVRRMLATSV
jgi:hypothetical protein